MAASLSPGVLQKLLQEMGSPDEDSRSPPALLQVTSIVPAIGGGGGLFPDRGFFLKVSDSSHAIYAALPQEQGDLILADELRLGQLIHVCRLEPASPVPVLRGVHPLPGCHPLGNPSDLVPAGAARDPPASSPTGFLSLGRGPPPAGPPLPEGRKKPRSASASRRGSGDGWRSSRKGNHASRSIPTSPVRGLSRRYSADSPSSEILKELAKISVACVREDSDDSDSSRSSASSSVSRPRTLRRSWDATTGRDPMRIPRSSQMGSAGQNKFAQSGMHLPGDYSSDHQLTGRREAGQATRVPRSSRQQKLYVSNKMCKERSCSSCSFGSADDVRRAEGSVLPASLPSNLLKIGKEVLRHRDLMLLTAVEALQEASASDRLIQCLSAYPELQSSKEDDPQGLVDRFLSFLEDLRQARLVAQSLVKVTPRTANSDSISSLSTKDAVKIATENRKHAASWIKAAMESNNSPPSTLMKPVDSTADPATDVKPSSTIPCSKFMPFLGKRRLNYDMWLKGTGPFAATDLANTLQGECNRWFLSHIEKFLDGILSETIDTASENQIAGLLFQIKKVDEWLEGVACRETSSLRDSYKENLTEIEEAEACQRVRKKIYGILLKHVNRAAIALENMSTTDEGSASEGLE